MSDHGIEVICSTLVTLFILLVFFGNPFAKD